VRSDFFSRPVPADAFAGMLESRRQLAQEEQAAGRRGRRREPKQPKRRCAAGQARVVYREVASPMRMLPTILVLLGAAWGPFARSADYASDVKPLLEGRCYACHGTKMQMSGLRLDSAAAITRGGKHGPIVVPGNPGASRLIQAVRGAPGLERMPFGQEPLAEADIAKLEAWIAAGAAAPADDAAPEAPAARHWSFVPPRRGELPPVRDAAWPRNEIDRFVLARLEKEGLTPSPEADRPTLIRRVTLDLTGLPPTPAEIDAFTADARPDAYERLVDRLLASPRYGERWGRHWLDLARYADSNGYSIDGPREMWKYRDWVVAALNRDMPFDRFTIEQVAGDMLPGATVEQRLATGFHRNTPFNQEGGIDLEQFRVDAIADRVATTGTVYLGLTLGCARCHDHKFDPIPQRDYYRMFAFLNNADEPQLELAPQDQIDLRHKIQPEITKLDKELQEAVSAWLKDLSEERRRGMPRDVLVILALQPQQRDERQRDTLAAYLKEHEPTMRDRVAAIEELRRREPKYPTSLILAERAEPRATHVHVGGDFTRPGAKVEPGVPGVLHALHAGDRPNRLDFARWLVDPANPLVGRVTMNRSWQQFFGKGLVETENDFGTQGSPPSHPELLDWLALEFPARGWSMKAMHRLMVTSATYRQASRGRPELTERDPYNRLLGRQARLRLEAEAIRDSALAVAGVLAEELGGPPVFPPQPDGVFGFTQIPRVWTASTGPARYRRALYTHFWRSAPYPALLVFDAPDAIAACTRRNRSTTPMQALTLLNDAAYVELAQAFAARITREAGPGDRERVRHGFRLSTGRAPTEAETRRLETFLGSSRLGFRDDPDGARRFAGSSGGDVVERAAWTALARVLLNLDEFVTRE
jgi:cytochrome c553